MQAKVFGGLKPETHRLLMSIAEADAAKRKGEAPPAPKFRPGVRLLREWNGTVHTVDVLDKGFAWNGKLYASAIPNRTGDYGGAVVRSAVLHAMTGKNLFRCAVYTRKSTEEGLEQEFNSLDAQREACEPSSGPRTDPM
jgi:hypothetical protein